jgi:hypothetical protein
MNSTGTSTSRASAPLSKNDHTGDRVLVQNQPHAVGLRPRVAALVFGDNPEASLGGVKEQLPVLRSKGRRVDEGGVYSSRLDR